MSHLEPNRHVEELNQQQAAPAAAMATAASEAGSAKGAAHGKGVGRAISVEAATELLQQLQQLAEGGAAPADSRLPIRGYRRCV